MGRSVDYLDIVLTCKGDYYAPGLSQQLDLFKSKLQRLIAKDTQSLVFKKVEPWNSIKVTFQIPKDAADRLRLLASNQMRLLNEMGILGVKIGEEDLFFNDMLEQNLDPSLDNIPLDDKNPAGSNACAQLSFLPGNVQNITKDFCNQPIKRGRGAPRGPRKRKINPNDISTILNLDIETKKKAGKKNLPEVTSNCDELPELIGDLFDCDESFSGFGNNSFFDKSNKDALLDSHLQNDDMSGFNKITQRINQQLTNGFSTDYFLKNIEMAASSNDPGNRKIINIDLISKSCNSLPAHQKTLTQSTFHTKININGFKESEKFENFRSSLPATNFNDSQSTINNSKRVRQFDQTKKKKVPTATLR